MAFDYSPLQITTVKKESVPNLLDLGLEYLAKDIKDARKKAGAKRYFDLRVTVAPDDEATSASISLKISKIALAPTVDVSFPVVLETKHGRLEFMAFEQGEIEMPDNVSRMEDRNE